MYFYGLTIPPKKSNLRHISVLTKLLMAVIQNQSHLLSLLQDFRTRVDASCRYSEEFTNIYYDCMDKKRRVGTDSPGLCVNALNHTGTNTSLGNPTLENTSL